MSYSVSKLNIPIIIGLCGKAGSGKDTIADILYKEYGIQKVAFADDLKRRAMTDFGFSFEQVYGTEKETVVPEYNKSPRQILQLMGTEWYRSIDPNFWVKSLHKYLISNQNHYFKGVCITDVRFENEVEFLNQIGGTIFKIIRPNHFQTIHTNHVSETSLDNIICPIEIVNDGTIRDLQHTIKLVMKDLGI